MAVDRLRAAHMAMLRDGTDAFSPAGLEYLYGLIQRAAFPGKGAKDLRAGELCRAFGRAAAADFGPFLPEALARMGMRTGAELGRAVFLLAAQGCLALRDGETQEEYAVCGELGGKT